MEDRKKYFVEKLYVRNGMNQRKVSFKLDDKFELIEQEKSLAAFRFYERDMIEIGHDRIIYGDKTNFSKWIVMDQYYYKYDKNQMSYSEYLVRLENKKTNSVKRIEGKVYKKV